MDWYRFRPQFGLFFGAVLIPRLAYWSLFFSVAWLVTLVIISFVHCRPLRHNWESPLENRLFCFPLKPYILFHVSFGCLLDGVIWSLPHVVVWQLRLRRAHKIAITIIFALGLLCEPVSGAELLC